MRLTVTAKELRYAGKTLRQGEDFDASDKDARILKAIGKAEECKKPAVRAPAPRPASPRRPAAAATSPSLLPAHDPDGEGDNPTGAAGDYGRRDMRARD